MADIFSKKKRSEIMSKIKNKNSKIEVLFRKKLWKQGFRYRKNSTRYFGKPDIVLPKYKTVIFIDSCFWHGCKKHYYAPVTRKKYWSKKIERNKERDGEVSKYYRERKWNIFRIWEHALSNKNYIFDFDKIKTVRGGVERPYPQFLFFGHLHYFNTGVIYTSYIILILNPLNI
jgi:DNA mismatch endonuclease (patch repair protein)